LRELIAKKRGINVGHDGYLGIERSYCNKTLDSVTAFFDGIFESAGFGKSLFKWKQEQAVKMQADSAARLKGSNHFTSDPKSKRTRAAESPS